MGTLKGKGMYRHSILKERMQGKYSQGRPRNIWFTDIKEWTGRKGVEKSKMAADHNLFCEILAQPLSKR